VALDHLGRDAVQFAIAEVSSVAKLVRQDAQKGVAISRLLY
jgi:hypothetical protein